MKGRVSTGCSTAIGLTDGSLVTASSSASGGVGVLSKDDSAVSVRGGGVGMGDPSGFFLPMLPMRRSKLPPALSFFFLSMLGELSVLREASLATSRCFLFRLRIVRSSRTISPSEAEDLPEPERLSDPMWKGEPERNGERSVWSVRRRRDGGVGEGGGIVGSSSRMVVSRVRRADCRVTGDARAPADAALHPDERKSRIQFRRDRYRRLCAWIRTNVMRMLRNANNEGLSDVRIRNSCPTRSYRMVFSTEAISVLNFTKLKDVHWFGSFIIN